VQVLRLEIQALMYLLTEHLRQQTPIVGGLSRAMRQLDDRMTSLKEAIPTVRFVELMAAVQYESRFVDIERWREALNFVLGEVTGSYRLWVVGAKLKEIVNSPATVDVPPMRWWNEQNYPNPEDRSHADDAMLVMILYQKLSQASHTERDSLGDALLTQTWAFISHNVNCDQRSDVFEEFAQFFTE
jgi:hypothetical protein